MIGRISIFAAAYVVSASCHNSSVARSSSGPVTVQAESPAVAGLEAVVESFDFRYSAAQLEPHVEIGRGFFRRWKGKAQPVIRWVEVTLEEVSLNRTSPSLASEDDEAWLSGKDERGEVRVHLRFDENVVNLKKISDTGVIRIGIDGSGRFVDLEHRFSYPILID